MIHDDDYYYDDDDADADNVGKMKHFAILSILLHWVASFHGGLAPLGG